MREILFRGKRIYDYVNESIDYAEKDDREWVYGDIIHRRYYKNKDVIVIRTEDSGFDNYSDYEVDPSTIGQYTGLTDKNGKKIFEGDILAAPDYPNLKYKVSFANANFCVKCPAQSYLFYLGSRCFDMFGNPEYEIVGNIHDNPELLEEKE